MADTAAPGRRRFLVGKRLAPYVFLLPFLLLFIAFLIIPLINALGLSVYKTTLVGGTRSSGSTTSRRPSSIRSSGAGW